MVGLAASIGAGISMGFAEALSDDGKLSGRGSPLLRGLVCGLMTTAEGSATPCPTSSRTSIRRPSSPSAWLSSNCDDLLGPVALHGRAARVGRGQGHARRRSGAGGGHSDRGELTRRICAPAAATGSLKPQEANGRWCIGWDQSAVARLALSALFAATAAAGAPGSSSSRRALAPTSRSARRGREPTIPS